MNIRFFVKNLKRLETSTIKNASALKGNILP